MNSLTLSTATMFGVLTLVSGCTSSHNGHGGSDDHHASGAADAGHGHGSGDEGHHESEIGMPGDAGSVDRTIAVSMDDTMRFLPAEFDVVAGETIQFNITNNGKIPHEFVLGSESEIMEHHELMKKFPGMEHEEPNSVSLEAAKEGVVIWTFTKAGTVDIACLKAGHFEAGMKGSVSVAAK